MKAVEEFYSLLSAGLVAMNRHCSIYDFLHFPAQSPNIIEGYWATNVQINIITVAYWNVYRHLTTLKNIVSRLAEHKEQAAGIGTRTTRRGDIKKLYLFLLVHPVMHALYLVVDMSIQRSVFHLETRLLVNLLNVRPNRHFYLCIVV